ncbi:MAG: hypothetical protein QGG09_02060, partial [Pirellulaceae bacterium]|nr:hypothetical protein [Pirellulaceae bacterium]
IVRRLRRAFEKMTDTIGLSQVGIYDRIAGENHNFICEIHNEGVKRSRTSRKKGGQRIASGSAGDQNFYQ